MAVLVKKRDRLMSIDPSINNLGLAIWEVQSKKLLMYKLLHPDSGLRENEFDKSLSMLDQIKQWRLSYGINKIILEIPEQWAVAGFQARETGSMTKLMFVCGMLYSIKNDVEEYTLVTPRAWKGQLSKEVMVNRLKDHYLKIDVNLAKMDSNVADAIGIGHFYLYGRV